MPSFSEQTKIAFPAEIQMISCHNDDQDVTFETVGPYDLPVPGKGTFCAEAMVHSLWDDPRCTSPEHITWIDLLQRMSTYLQDQGVSTARPRLSSSRLLQVQQPLVIVPSTMGNHSVKRAVLIGIHYVGHEHALTNCHNNVNSMASYLMKVHGFQEHNVTILMDNSLRQEPTRHNILRAFQRICKLSKAGDVAVIQFSGHGGRWKDDADLKQTVYAETIVPVDFQTAGHIRDDEIYKNLFCSMPAGVHTTIVMDACHSAVKLPYELNAPSSIVNPTMVVGMAEVSTFAFTAVIALAVGGAVLGVASGLTGEEGNGVAGECCDSLYSALFD